MSSRVVRCVVLSCAGLFVVVSPAFAQRDLEIPIQFDFINPGARSLALAGAFIGLADDATAATTNPAGLQRLARPEVSVEGRGWKFFTDFVDGGRLSGITQGVITATDKGIDTIDGPRYSTITDRVGGIAFLSFVYPKGRWSVAGYRQEASRLRGTAVTEGAFFTDFTVQPPQEFREYPSVVSRALDVVNYGGSFAYRAGKVSVGGGVNMSHLDFDSGLIAYELPGLQEPEFYSAAVYTDERYASAQISDDWAVGFTAGVMVVPTDKFQVGASYRRGARFTFDGGFQYDDPQFSNLSKTYTADFKVPDNIGAGFAVRPFDGLTIAMDINRVTYSDLSEFIQAQVVFDPNPANYSISDATEVHLGGEYVFTNWRFLPAVRGGFWREGDHSVTYGGTDILYQATSALARAYKHYSVGGGVAPSQRWEVNAGFDFSDRANTMSFSGIFRF
jgi:long-chain fatty acid transport protein